MVTVKQGAILAAGRGDRIRTPQYNVPKPLIDLCGEPLLVRQARGMMEAGAERVVTVINSETAAAARTTGIKFPRGLEVHVRDTANSMETLFALGEFLSPGRFLMATVDAVMSPPEFNRFAQSADALSDPSRADSLDGALGVVQWRGDKRPLFVELNARGLIERMGDVQTSIVTAGVYLLPTTIFDLAAEARRLRLDALRRFLGLLLNQGARWAAIELQNVVDIDEPGDLDAARAMLAAGTRTAGTI